MRRLLKKIWRKWKATILQINAGIAFVLMSITFFTAVMPVAFGFKILRKIALDRSLGNPNSKTYWLKRQDHEQDIRRVQRLY